MDAWIRSTKRPSLLRRIGARLGLVRQAPIGAPLQEFPEGSVSRATVELSDETIAEYEIQDAIRKIHDRHYAETSGPLYGLDPDEAYARLQERDDGR